MTAFEAAVEKVIHEETGGDPEGGYTNDPRDRGGETKWGISKKSYPNLDIKNLSRADAVNIYHRDFWDALCLDALPERVAFAVFDSAVNSGVRPAARWLQRAVGVDVDGVIGPKTIAAVLRVTDASSMLMKFYGARLMMLTDAATWDIHGRGWSRRVARDLLQG